MLYLSTSSTVNPVFVMLLADIVVFDHTIRTFTGARGVMLTAALPVLPEELAPRLTLTPVGVAVVSPKYTVAVAGPAGTVTALPARAVDELLAAVKKPVVAPVLEKVLERLTVAGLDRVTTLPN